MCKLGTLTMVSLRLILLMTTLSLSLSSSSSLSEPASCHKASHPPLHKPTVVLVHGFTGAGWNWFKVAYRLEMSGYKVMAPDLAASGLDRTDISEVDTFEQYNEPLERLMSSLPVHEKVVLVGHSAGGVSLTKILHHHAAKVHVAVYVAATMLKYGYLSCEDLNIGVPGFSELSTCYASCPKLPEPTCFDKTLLGPSSVPLITLTESFVLGRMLQRPGPLRAIVTTNFKEVAKGSVADTVPRVYIKTRFDRVVTPAMQDRMIARWPPCEVFEVDCDHDVPSDKAEVLSALIVNVTSYAIV